MNNEQIKQILEFYANAQNYERQKKYITDKVGFGWIDLPSNAELDAGEKARKALSKLGDNNAKI